jgi:hypothetical protein
VLFRSSQVVAFLVAGLIAAGLVKGPAAGAGTA